jgi:hypothetical protein
MKAKIICTKCKIQLGELSKPVITDDDKEQLKKSMICDEGHDTIDVIEETL